MSQDQLRRVALLNLPIITSGRRADQKTQSTKHVEPAETRIRLPVDLLELWSLLDDKLPGFLGRCGRRLSMQHGGGSLAVAVAVGGVLSDKNRDSEI